jgi:quercetin dioxygenase-like cupin family protein
MTHTLPIKPLTVSELVTYQDGSVVSREIVRTRHTTITAFAFAQGQGLSEHTTPFTALAQILDGEAEITVGGEKHTVKAGELLTMPANSPHALQAHHQFKMLLTMAKEAASVE